MHTVKNNVKKLSNAVLSCAIVMSVSGNIMAAEQAANGGNEITEDIYATPFDVCFENSYHATEVTKNEAFEIAECFTSLLKEQDSAGANMETVMQYSASWYSIAAEKGHVMAKASLSKSLDALHQLTTDSSETMLASEQKFHSLDSDQNGMLSELEVASIAELKTQFTASDFDRDGQLSFGEYTIMAGEATAAGN